MLLAVREQWAQAVFTPPKPLTSEVVNVSGTDLVPLAGGLGLAALAGLVAVIATRGWARRGVGALLALFGAGAGAAVLTTVTAQTVLSVAAGKVASPGSAALSGAAGSTTGGSSSGGSALVVTGTAGHAIMTGTPWQAAVIIGALLIFAAGVATALRGQDWPVMSARYDAPGGRGAPGAGQAKPSGAGRRPRPRTPPRCGSPSTAAKTPPRTTRPRTTATKTLPRLPPVPPADLKSVGGTVNRTGGLAATG